MASFFFHEEPYLIKFASVHRMIVDFSDKQNFIVSIDSGLEQRPFSNHTKDLMDIFLNEGFITLPRERISTENIENIITIKRNK